MSSLVFLIPLALALGTTALIVFFWSLRSGQYDDLDGASERIFIDPEADRAGGALPNARPNPPAPRAGPGGRP